MSIQEFSEHGKKKIRFFTFLHFSWLRAIENGGTSLCRTETLNKSEFPL